ncbi:MAG: ATP-dependent DNA ligase [Candidatus Thorarchaeota archaeon]
MLYRELASAYDQIESVSGMLEKIRLFSEVLKRAAPSEVAHIVALTLGRLFPDWMGEPELGLAEKTTIQVVAAAASVRERDVLELLKKTGDIGTTAEELLRNSAQGSLFREEITVKRVFDTLYSVAKSSGQGSTRDKVSILVGLLADAEPIEARYILRTVIGDLRLGLGTMSIVDALALAFTEGKSASPIIERALYVNSDLPNIAHILASQGIDAVRQIGIEVGRPIMMMAAKKLANPREILEKTGGRALVEYKYDGERLQIHKRGSEIILFSRRHEMITAQYPDIVELVKNSVTARECVLEGECVATDIETGRVRPFQELMRRRRKTGIDAMTTEVPTALYLFDALYVDGRTIMDLPLLERRKMLENIVKVGPRMDLTRAELTDQPERLNEILSEALSEGHEGVIAKAVHEQSVYQPGQRSWLWIKLKASYSEVLADSFDLVVVGAMHGRGKRTGVYGAILAAVYDPETDSYPTVCKIGTGFTDQMLTQFKERLDHHIIPVRHPRVVSDIEADVWFEPRCVIEVLGDEITVSPIHPAGRDRLRAGGLAIRFPRFTGRWRDDKDPTQASTVDDLVEVFEKQRGPTQGEDADGP